MLQVQAIDIMKLGNNVFLTGSAGSGKTYVLNQYIAFLRSHGISPAITASTGIAATHLGGITIHSWSGMGLKDTITQSDLEIMESKKYLWDRYQKAQVVIIDEISMLSAGFIDNFDKVCRHMRRSQDPFGGIQIILCGDFFQLPPVTKEGVPSLVFESGAWKSTNFVVCYLTESHRHEDPEFLEILNAIRENRIDDYHKKVIDSRVDETLYESGEMTQLYTHNAAVDTINKTRLDDIGEPVVMYQMTSRGKDILVETLKRGCLALESLETKLGAQVVCIKNNQEKGYVNGTRGVIVDYSEEGYPIIETLAGDEIEIAPETWEIVDDRKVLASISQIPLRLAWAITVHKSQGMSLDQAVMDLSKPFAYGMGYVALSRVRSLAGLRLVGISDGAYMVDPKVLEFDKELRAQSDRASEVLASLSPEEFQNGVEAYIIAKGGVLREVDAGGPEARPHKEPKIASHLITFDILARGLSLHEAATERDLAIGTIIEHVGQLTPEQRQIISHVSPPFELIELLRDYVGYEKLTPIKRALSQQGIELTFDEIKLALAFLRR
jgi:hypothetical protein